jgi:hypothetical protein
MSDMPRAGVRRWWRRHRAGRSRSDAGGVDKLGDAREPPVVPGRGGPVAQQLLSHEESGLWSWTTLALARGSARRAVDGRLQLP